MATPTRLVTPRDRQVFRALAHCPLTVRQLLKFSQTFDRPFTSERRLQHRLQLLRDAGRVRRFAYATAGPGAPSYYTLSPDGYRIVRGEDVPPLTKRHFGPVGVAMQAHTNSLAEFIVHTAVTAHGVGVRFANFQRENTFSLEAADEAVQPDCAFQLVRPGGVAFSFFVELDNGTEPIRSEKDRDSWQRKLRIYEAYQQLSMTRFRLLVVSAHSGARLQRILDLASELLRNPQRSLVYGITLAAYLDEPDAVQAHCFRDQRGRAASLLLPPLPVVEPVSSQRTQPLFAVPVGC